MRGLGSTSTTGRCRFGSCGRGFDPNSGMGSHPAKRQANKSAYSKIAENGAGHLGCYGFHQFRARRQSSVTTTTASTMAPTRQSRPAMSNAVIMVEVVTPSASPPTYYTGTHFGIHPPFQRSITPNGGLRRFGGTLRGSNIFSTGSWTI
jgi:hypothetical protein